MKYSGAKEWVRVGESASADQITLDMFWALTNVPHDKIHVIGEQTSQALISHMCLVSLGLESAHS